MSKNEILLGFHASIAKGVYNALYQGKKLGANTVQIFTQNQRQWKGKALTTEDIEKWNIAKKETNIHTVMSHNSYLINLGSNKKDLLAKSRKAFEEEIKRCHILDIDYLTFHPGSATGETEEKCLDAICESILSFSNLLKKGKTILTIETTAGQGSNVGYKFEHLAYIIKNTNKKVKIGVCFDTCHVFSSGYDIRNEKAWEKTLSEFDKIIGLKHLTAFHLNDSKFDIGSRKDRHEHIGKGKIGLDCFKYLMQNKKTKYLPKYLETPNTLYWKDEIKLLLSFANKK